MKDKNKSQLAEIDNDEFLKIILSKETDDATKDKMYRITYETLEMDDINIDTNLIDECIKTVEMIEGREAIPDEKIEEMKNNVNQICKQWKIQKKEPKDSHKLTGKVAVSLLLVLTITGFVVNANGYNIFQIISDWGKETFYLTVIGNMAEKENSKLDIQNISDNNTYTNMDDAIKSITPKPKIPSNTLEGFILEYIERTNLSEQTILSLNYINQDRRLTIYLDIRNESNKEINYESLIEKDNSPVEVYTKNNIKHYIMKNNNKVQGVWIYNNTIYTTSGDISIEETKKIIDTIYGE